MFNFLVQQAKSNEPVVGIPGAICLGKWQGEALQLLGYEALCSLNAGCFLYLTLTVPYDDATPGAAIAVQSVGDFQITGITEKGRHTGFASQFQEKHQN